MVAFTQTAFRCNFFTCEDAHTRRRQAGSICRAAMKQGLHAARATTMCTYCDCLLDDRSSQSLSTLRRKAVRRRFFDLFETYECPECGANWERAVLTPDKYPVKYRWRLLCGPTPSASPRRLQIVSDNVAPILVIPPNVASEQAAH
jgi:hypothetical protein